MTFLEFLIERRSDDTQVGAFARYYVDITPDRPRADAGCEEICGFLKETFTKDEGRDDLIADCRMAWRDYHSNYATTGSMYVPEVESEFKHADPVGRVTTEHKK